MGLVGLGYVDRPKPGVTYANAMFGGQLPTDRQEVRWGRTKVPI